MIVRTGILGASGDHTPNQHRFCTPSILPEIDHEIGRPSVVEASISDDQYGSHLDGTGHLGDAARVVACAHRSDRALVLDGGSTEGNRILTRYLACRYKDAFVLVAPHAHHSVTNNLMVNGIDFGYLPTPPYAAHFEALLPPSVDDIIAGLQRRPEAVAVMITSPTYEGLQAPLVDIIAAVRRTRPDVLVVVDEAWGSHLSFDPDAGTAAMSAGADVCVQSTHKLGGSMQGGALLLWREERVDSEALQAAYAESVSTSPNFLVIGSVELATRILSGGRQHIRAAAARAEIIRDGIDAIDGLAVLRATNDVDPTGRHVVAVDPLKVQIAVGAYDVSGFDLKSALHRARCIPEKAGLRTLLLVSTYQLSESAPAAVVAAIADALCSRGRVDKGTRADDVSPFAFGKLDAEVSPSLVRRVARHEGAVVSAERAIGEIAAEAVELYPPGVPVIRPGWRVTAEAVEFLRLAVGAGARVVGRDRTVSSVRILRRGLRHAA